MRDKTRYSTHGCTCCPHAMQDCHAQMSADVARKAYTHAFGWRAGIIVVKVLWLMVTEGVAEMLAPITLFHFDLAAVGAIPVMVFAYHCHVQSVPIYYELSFDPALFDLSLIHI